MKHDRFSVALCSVVLLTCPLAAQRTRVLVATTNAGAQPVTAHRQVAWSSWGTVYLWNGSSVITIPTGGQSVDSVGFVGPGRLFVTVQGGPSFGYNVYDVATATMTRLLTNPIDLFHTDGTAAVFPRPAYAGFGLYTAGTSYTEFVAGAATTYAPNINGRYVVYQRRSGTGFTDYDVFRYDRTSGSTTSASSNQGGTDARVDEAGRVVWMKGANTSLAQLWWNDFVSGPRVIAGVGFGAMTNRYDAHLGQLVYARLRSSGSIPYDLFFEEGAAATGQGSRVRRQVGEEAWVEGQQARTRRACQA